MNTFTRHEEQGISLIEVLISLLLAALIMAGAFSAMALVAQNETQSEHLNARIIQSELMKSALNNTVTDAGGLIAPTIPTNSSSSTGSGNSTTQPFNLFGLIDNILFGDCDSSSLLSTVVNDALTLTSQLLTGHGYITGNTTSVSSSNTGIPSTTIPTPITVNTNQVDFYYLMEDDGSQELCHGTLTIQNNEMDYTLSGNSTSGTSACTPNGATEESTRFMVGPGWSFTPLSTSSGCLGDGFKNNTGAQLTAVQSAQNGLPGTEVSVCLPNM
jgi:Type II secretory pathway, component PulJ